MTESPAEPPTVEQLQKRIVILESDRRNRGRLWLFLSVSLLLAVIAGGILVQRANDRSIERERVARVASEQAFCGIIVLLDDAWSTTPPTTPSGRQLAAAVSTARIVNHCPARRR